MGLRLTFVLLVYAWFLLVLLLVIRPDLGLWLQHGLSTRSLRLPFELEVSLSGRLASSGCSTQCTNQMNALEPRSQRGSEPRAQERLRRERAAVDGRVAGCAPQAVPVYPSSSRSAQYFGMRPSAPTDPPMLHPLTSVWIG